MLQCSVAYNHFSHRLHATLVDLSAKKALLCKNSLQRPVLLSLRRFSWGIWITVSNVFVVHYQNETFVWPLKAAKPWLEHFAKSVSTWLWIQNGIWLSWYDTFVLMEEGLPTSWWSSSFPKGWIEMMIILCLANPYYKSLLQNTYALTVIRFSLVQCQKQILIRIWSYRKYRHVICRTLMYNYVH